MSINPRELLNREDEAKIIDVPRAAEKLEFGNTAEAWLVSLLGENNRKKIRGILDAASNSKDPAVYLKTLLSANFHQELADKKISNVYESIINLTRRHNQEEVPDINHQPLEIISDETKGKVRTEAGVRAKDFSWSSDAEAEEMLAIIDTLPGEKDRRNILESMIANRAGGLSREVVEHARSVFKKEFAKGLGEELFPLSAEPVKMRESSIIDTGSLEEGGNKRPGLFKRVWRGLFGKK
jgi:hypothetical protein